MLNQKGIAHLLLLLTGLGVIVYFVLAGYAPFKDTLNALLYGKPSSMASEGTDLSKVGDFETIALNNYADAWAWKKSKTSDSLPISGGAPGFSEYAGVTAHLYPDTDNSILEKYTTYLSKSNAEYLYVDSMEPSFEGTRQRTKDLLYKLHQKNPNVKILGYFVMHEPTTDAWASYPEAWFVHQKDVPQSQWGPANRINRRPEDSNPHPLMDITNDDFREFAIRTTVDNMRASGTNGLAGFNGIMSDLMYADGLKRLKVHPDRFDPNYPRNVVSPQIAADWTRYMIQFTQELKTAMGSDLLLFGNVEDDDTSFMESDLLRDGRLDGVIFEDPFNHIDTTGPVALQKAGGLMNKMKTSYPSKRAIFMVTGEQSGKVLDSRGEDIPHSEAEERRRHMYFLTAYLTMWNGNKNHSFEYYHPRFIPKPENKFFRLHFNSNAFFKEWDLGLGAPVDGQDLGDGLYLRNYTNGKVYWNSTNRDLPIPAGSGLVSVTDGQPLAPGKIVKGKSGDIYVSSEMYAGFNTPVPDPLGSCTNRPIFDKTETVTSGGILVTITPRTSTTSTPPVPSNFIYSISFTGLDSTAASANSNVYVPYTGEGSPFYDRNFTYQANAQSVAFLVQPKTPSTAFTVNLNVTDRCGAGATTFLGRGAAFYNRTLSAQDAAVLKPNFTAATSNSCNGTASKAHLEWYQVPNASGYNIYRNSTKIGGTSGLAYNDDTAVQGTAYTYQIRAVVNGLEVQGAAQQITAASNCLQLSAPNFGGNTVAKCNGPKPRNYLEWLPVQGATVYKVYRSTSQAGSGIKLADITTNVFNDDNVTPGVTYSYQIEAANGTVSKLGAGKNLTTLTTCMPKPEFNAKTGTYCTNQPPTGARVHLEWNAIPGAGYKIFRSTTAAGSGVKIGETSGTAWNDDNVTPGAAYQYSVEANVGTTTSAGAGKNIVVASGCSPATPAPTPAPVCGSDVHSFYYTNNTSRYLSINKNYFSTLQTSGWKDEGIMFYAYPTSRPQTVPVYSFYHTSNYASRYFTTNTGYFSALQAGGWVNEGIMFYAHTTQVSGTVPVYSFYYTGNNLDRYLTTNTGYFSALQAGGWINEGIMFYAYPNLSSSCK